MSVPTDQPPKPEEIPLLAEKLVYEFRMWTLGLGMCGMASGEVGARNAWLEVFLLHTRTLADFFLSAPEKDDLVASHFVHGWTVTEDEQRWLREQKRRLNKSLAHLTASRVREARPTYSIDEIRRRVIALWSRFEAECWSASTDGAEALASLLTLDRIATLAPARVGSIAYAGIPVGSPKPPRPTGAQSGTTSP